MWATTRFRKREWKGHKIGGLAAWSSRSTGRCSTLFLSLVMTPAALAILELILTSSDALLDTVDPCLLRIRKPFDKIHLHKARKLCHITLLKHMSKTCYGAERTNRTTPDQFRTLDPNFTAKRSYGPNYRLLPIAGRLSISF